MWKRLAALALVSTLAAAPAQPEAVMPMGLIELAYDPARFVVEAGRPGVWNARPVHETEGQSLVITELYGGPCSEEAMAALAFTQVGFEGSRRTQTLASGLVVHYAFGSTGCRNATPAPTAACVRHQGQTLLFTTPPAGCRGHPFGDDTPEALLAGLRPRF